MLARVVFYSLLPCLAFRLLVTSSASGQNVARLMLLAVLIMGATGWVGYVAAKGLGEVIIAGLLSNNTAFILQGGLVTGLMAILLYDLLAAVERRVCRTVALD